MADLTKTTRANWILHTVEEAADNLLYCRDDEGLMIEELKIAIADGEITFDEIAEAFKNELETELR